jgi:septal ring factor EnvC (AmiA/AmiB activator)
MMWVTLAAADTREQETEARIAALKTQIAALQKRIQQKQGERDVLQTQLRDADKRVNELDNSLAQLGQAVEAETSKLATLAQQQQHLQEQVADARDTLDAELQNLWALQQGGGIRVVFGDQKPERLARNLAYYKRLLDARQSRIKDFTALLEQVRANTQAIEAVQAALAKQQQALAVQRQELTALQTSRRDTLNEIQRSLNTDSARKDRLEADAKQLATLLEELRATLEELDTPSSYVAFEEARGAMPMPVTGRASNRFGSSRNIGDMRWRGWTIPAAEGADVRAIHHGRVVYADWLRGQGLLIILDHGDGYLSLYAHNRSLSRDVGDWVAPGDTIATVGNSGGAEYPGLYFEIRHEGEPVNPSPWIKR